MKRNGICYYCGSPATSREHIPPRLLFRRTGCDSIVVPSCDLHNTQKSGSDQAVANALVNGIRRLPKRGTRPTSQVAQQAIERLSRNLHRSKRLVSEFRLDGAKSPCLTYLHAEAAFPRWMRQITAGLVCDVAGPVSATVDWDSAIVWSPSYVRSREPAISAGRLLKELEEARDLRDKANSLEWERGWSARPKPYPREIYRFEFICSADEVVFRHVFFEQYEVFVLFQATAGVLEGIGRRAGSPGF